MDTEAPKQWVCAGSSMGIDGDLQADLLVTNLQGADIPVVRLPILPTTVLPMANWPMIRPARVFVPQEYGPIAQEIEAEQPRHLLEPNVCALMGWALAVTVVAYAGMVQCPGTVVVAAFIVVALAVRAFVQLAASLLRQGRLKADARPIAAGLLLMLVLTLLAAPLTLQSEELPDWEQAGLRLVIVAAYCVMAYGAARLLCRRPSPGRGE